MRLRRLHLDRFGIFTDRSLELPSSEVDFHLVAGANETGKSTLRAALSELLFGIQERCPFVFLHEGKHLRLGAAIAQGDDELEFVRLKRRKQPLQTPAETPLPDDALAPFLGGIDRAFFTRMFNLDHAELTSGGQNILSAKDDVAQILFEAAAGLQGLGRIREELEAEAKSLWDRRRSKDRLYYQAQDRYDEAQAALRAATVRPAAWKQARALVEERDEQLRTVDAELRALDQEAARLERIRRVAPHLRSRAELLAGTDAVEAAVLLPPTAAGDLGEAREGIVRAEARITQHRTLAGQAQARAASIEVEEAILAEQSVIEELEERRARTKDFPVQIEKREAEAQALRRTVARIARELGWEDAEDEVLATRLPSAVVRAEITALLKRHGALTQALDDRARAVRQQEADLASLHRELAELVVQDPPATLADHLASAQRLGDARDRLEQLRASLSGARGELDDALARLAPWAGDLDELATLPLPSAERVQEWLASSEQLERQRVAHRERQQDLKGTLERHRLEVDQLRRDQGTVASSEVSAAREERDALWSRIRAGEAPLTTVGDTYEERVEAADELADRRYQGAEQAQRIELLEATIERENLEREQVAADEQAVTDRLEALRREWSDGLAAAGLGELPPKAFASWSERHAQALTARRLHSTAEQALVAFERRVHDEASALRGALAEVGTIADDLAALDLSALVRHAREVLSQAEVTRATRAQLERRHREAATELQQRAEAHDQAQRDLAAWQERWEQRLIDAALPGTLGPDGASTALELLQELAATLKELGELRRARLDTMRRDLAAFEEDAAGVVARIAPELAGQPAARAVPELVRRLSQAASRRSAKLEAEREAEQHDRHHRDAERELDEARRRIQPLFDAVGVSDVDELVAAIQASDRRREHARALEKATRETLEAGDGLPLEALEEEVAAQDLVALPAQAAEVARKRKEAEQGRDAALVARKEAQEQLDRIAGQADAANAAARAEEALSDMAVSVERYLKVSVAARLLRWSVDRHREERQAPLLRRASELFATLTLGSFARLTVDFDGDTPELAGVRPDGRHTPVDGMSAATRDQLYLALRLAAVELHLERSHALPFLADDLFINYDDARARAGLEVLAGLARQTQVLFLTHHDHLVEIARDVFGQGLNVVSLGT